MSERRGDWRDILSAYHLALKGNKVWTGYFALLYGLFVLVLATYFYRIIAGWGWVTAPGAVWVSRLGWMGSDDSFLSLMCAGQGMEALRRLLPLLNPFAGNLTHLILSSLTYVALFWAISGTGGIIARLTALEYARDDFPVLADASHMVRSRRKDYFLAFLFPFLFVIGPAICNLAIGLLGSIPGIGRILLVPLYPVAGLLGFISWLFAIGWVLSFGLMMPAISVDGKDSFDGWSTSYAYVLWQFGRYICYMAVAGVMGIVAAVAAYWVIEALIYVIYQSINMGFVRQLTWMRYEVGGPLGSVAWAEGRLAWVTSVIITYLTLGLRGIPVAYVISYFFTANTIVFFLLRKHVDNIDIEEVYEEEAEEEISPAEVPMPGEPEEEAEEPEAEEPEEPQGEEPEEAPEEMTDEEAPESPEEGTGEEDT